MSNPLDAATLRAVRSHVHAVAPWPNPEWVMVLRVWLDEQLATAEEAAARKSARRAPRVVMGANAHKPREA